MSEFTPLEERFANLAAGISGMSDGQQILVNKAFLELVCADMSELLDLRRAQPANEPLTLDELRGMDGEPVKIDDDGAIFYGIVSLSGNCFSHNEEVITLADGNFYLLRDMDAKAYPALYRRKPEGGTT